MIILCDPSTCIYMYMYIGFVSNCSEITVLSVAAPMQHCDYTTYTCTYTYMYMYVHMYICTCICMSLSDCACGTVLPHILHELYIDG